MVSPRYHRLSTPRPGAPPPGFFCLPTHHSSIEPSARQDTRIIAIRAKATVAGLPKTQFRGKVCGVDEPCWCKRHGQVGISSAAGRRRDQQGRLIGVSIAPAQAE
jgi:hypothetical protein